MRSKFLVATALGVVALFLSCGVLDECCEPELTRSKLAPRIDDLKQKVTSKVGDSSLDASAKARMERASLLVDEATLLVKDTEAAETALQTARTARQNAADQLRQADAALATTKQKLREARSAARHEAGDDQQPTVAELEAQVEAARLAVRAARLDVQEGAEQVEAAQTLASTSLAATRRHYFLAQSEYANQVAPSPVEYPYYFKLHTGAATLRPYTVTGQAPGTRRIQASTETEFYVELDFLYRTAWLPPAAVSEDLAFSRSVARTLVPQDYEIRLGYVNGSQLVNEGVVDQGKGASGDWYTEATLGWVLGTSNITRQEHMRDEGPRGTWTFELYGKLLTDRQSLHSTGTYMAGIGTSWGIPIPGDAGGKKRMALLAAGLYYGVHEFPNADPDGTIRRVDLSVPYTRRGSVGVKVDFTVPVTAGMDFVVQGRHFSVVSSRTTESDWSLFVGATLPIRGILKAITE